MATEIKTEPQQIKREFPEGTQRESKRIIVECDVCEFVTWNNFEMFLHNERDHLCRQDYSCDTCEFSSDSKQNTINHRAEIHNLTT